MRLSRDQAAVISLIYSSEVEVESVSMPVISLFQEMDVPTVSVQAPGAVAGYLIRANGEHMRFSADGFGEVSTLELIEKEAK